MALNYTTLQSTVLDYAKRSELTTEVVQFIRAAESMIKSNVEALELRDTIVEADRSSEGVYNLSGQLLTVRAVYATNAQGDDYALKNVGVQGIKMLDAAADVQHYAIVGQTIEFRGVPDTDAEFGIVYLGWPDALATTSTNDLLTNYEDLYIYGTLFHLYNYTQDLELAQSALSVFVNVADNINKVTRQRIGGGSVLPAYNFGQVRVSTGY